MYVTIGRYLALARKKGPGEAAADREGMSEFCARTLEQVEQHAICAVESGAEEFRAGIRKIRDTLAAGAPEGGFSTLGDSVSTTLEAYGTWIKEAQRRQAAELNRMFSSLNQTVAVLSSGSHRSIANLRQIEKSLERASAVNDIVALKSRLSECLVHIREETARQREDVAHNLTTLSQTVTEARRRIRGTQSDLPGRDEAERALAEAMNRPAGQFAAVFALERFHLIASRFGDQAVGAALADLGRAMMARIADPKQLFRWNAGSLLLMMQRDDAAEPVGEIHKADDSAIESSLEVGERVAVLSLKNRWTLLKLTELPDTASAIANIEKFLGERT